MISDRGDSTRSSTIADKASRAQGMSSAVGRLRARRSGGMEECFPTNAISETVTTRFALVVGTQVP